MSSQNIPDPTLVTKTSELQKLIQKLSRQPLVAVDTEANSLYAYQERVCLIQFSIPNLDYLVDPLSLDDLSPLSSIFANPEIEKIFHAAEYDLIMLKQDFSFDFAGIFDTMLAARILGWKSVGLSSILKSQFGVVVDKKYQRANWGLRPLPAAMQTYAQFDTHYLIPLRKRLKSELKEKGRWDLALEDFRRVSKVNSNHHKSAHDCWRINGSRDLHPQQIAVLQELCHFRDQVAKASDRPLFKVISDTALIKISVANPRTIQELEQVSGISRKQVNWFGRGLIEAVQTGQKRNPPPFPQKPRLSDQHINRIEVLRRWRKVTARKLRVESDVILPKDVLYVLAEKNPKTKAEFGQLMLSVPWRLAQFGDEIFELLRATN
jgi:ribonuclease D